MGSSRSTMFDALICFIPEGKSTVSIFNIFDPAIADKISWTINTNDSTTIARSRGSFSYRLLTHPHKRVGEGDLHIYGQGGEECRGGEIFEDLVKSCHEVLLFCCFYCSMRSATAFEVQCSKFQVVG